MIMHSVVKFGVLFEYAISQSLFECSFFAFTQSWALKLFNSDIVAHKSWTDTSKLKNNPKKRVVWKGGESGSVIQDTGAAATTVQVASADF